MAEVKVAYPSKVEKHDRPAYETPKIQVMSEREILNTFQIVQAVTTWWTSC
jgi:hypothetical protein